MEANTLSFEAEGWERLEWRNPGLGIPQIGMLVSGAAAILFLYFAGQSGVGPVSFWFFHADWIVGIFFSLIAVFGIMMAWSLIYRARTYHLKPLEVTGTYGGSDGSLRLSYRNQKNQIRRNVVVKRIVPLDMPLAHPVGKYVFSEKGIRSSIRVFLTGNMLLELGFSDSREMRRVYETLASAMPQPEISS